VAAVDGRAAAGAEADVEVGSTAAWLRGRLRLSKGAAASAVRTTRALFRGPLAGTAQAVCAGAVSPPHASVLSQGTKDLPTHVTSEAEPVLLEAARRLDPTRLRRAVDHLVLVAAPSGVEAAAERRHRRRGLWLAPTFEGMVAVDGLLEPEAGQILLAALAPLARPADAGDTRTGSQRNADAWPSWPAGPWRPAGCPRPVGSARSWRWWWSWTASCTPAGVGWVERPAGPAP
jgi:Domain of unknown function (DUF222)